MAFSELQEFGYRRGLVLGFTAAEITTILLFLMLLLLGFYLEDFYNEDEPESTLSTTNSATTSSILSSEVLIEELKHLNFQLEDSIAKNVSYESTVTRLESELAAKIQEEQLQKEKISGLQSELKDSKAENVSFESAVARLESNSTANDEKIENLESELAAKIQEEQLQKEQISELQSELQESHNQYSQLMQESQAESAVSKILLAKNQSLQEKLNSMLKDVASKGQDSPCWFEHVDKGDGTFRERPLYIFDVKITDDHIYAVYPWATTKSDVIDQKESNFDQEDIEKIFVELKFDRSVLNRYLDYEEFITSFNNFRTFGEKRLIRSDRRCTFWVAVWDYTSETNKEGYKRAHEQIVGNVFNTFRYKVDAWPH